MDALQKELEEVRAVRAGLSSQIFLEKTLASFPKSRPLARQCLPLPPLRLGNQISALNRLLFDAWNVSGK